MFDKVSPASIKSNPNSLNILKAYKNVAQVQVQALHPASTLLKLIVVT